MKGQELFKKICQHPTFLMFVQDKINGKTYQNSDGTIYTLRELKLYLVGILTKLNYNDIFEIKNAFEAGNDDYFVNQFLAAVIQV